MRKLSMDELGRKTIEEFKQSKKNPIIVVLENIRSAYNVGSVFRTADAFLLEAVYTCGYTSHPPHKQITKTALGADETVNTNHFNNSSMAIESLKKENYKVFAVEQATNSIKLNKLKFNHEEKIAVIFGNEVSGVEQFTILLCDGCIEIPQLGMKHSLNISVAAGIVLWQLVQKQFENVQMNSVKNYLSLIKFSHTIFAMPFAMIGFFLGLKILNSQFSILKFFLVLVCMITARSSAMAFNRYLDRSFDAKNPRTAIREIPKGIISANNALMFTVISCLLFLVACFFLNKICFYLSPVALFIILFYSYTKRFTPLCHLVLGLGLSLAPIGAYLAVTGRFDMLPLLFSFAVIFWVSGFDIIYALQDIEFDQSQNLYSIPSTLGKIKALKVSEALHFLSAACVIAAGIYGNFHWLYWVGIAVFAGMLIYQHSIVKPNDLSKVNIAFMTSNGIASVVFGGLVIADILTL